MNKRRMKLLERKSKPVNETTVKHPVEEEMKELIKNEPIEQEKNPLKWFREHKRQYPLATRIYLKYASIQATSVPSERVFNIASMTFDDRPLLLPEKAEKSVILSDYYRRKDGENNYTLCQICKPARYQIMCMGHK